MKIPIMQKNPSLSRKEAFFGGSEYFEFGWVVFSGQTAKEESRSHWPCFCTKGFLAFGNVENFSGGQFLSWIEFMPWSTSRRFSLLSSPTSSLKISSIAHWLSAYALGPEILNCSWRDKNSNPLSFTSLAGLPASPAQIALPACALSVPHAVMASGHPWHGFTWLLWRNAFTDNLWCESESHRPT